MLALAAALAAGIAAAYVLDRLTRRKEMGMEPIQHRDPGDEAVPKGEHCPKCRHEESVFRVDGGEDGERQC